MIFDFMTIEIGALFRNNSYRKWYVLRLKIRCFLQFTYKNEVKTLALPYLEPWHIQTAVSTEVNRRRRVTKWLYQISLVVCLGILESFCLRTGRERISWLRRRRHIHGRIIWTGSLYTKRRKLYFNVDKESHRCYNKGKFCSTVKWNKIFIFCRLLLSSKYPQSSRNSW